MISKWSERQRSSMESVNEIAVEHYIDMSESSSNDSDKDPSYGDLEGTRSKLSNLSLKNKSKAWDEVDEIDDEVEIVEPGNDEVDQKSYEEVQRIIGDGKIEKLKVEQCKIYLRKNGLRLTGNKATLIHRINEHLEILNGGGEKKYPLRSFFVNCKGDACTGDVVLFEQNVYEMFNIASRSATGPACGTRLVAGRIVKESYGAAKQQHTFTVEVLWSKGEKPLPPLHPLLIKGRNLYRLKTLRQKWEDEEQRRKILMEKHSRGFVARCNRDARVREKENRKFLKPNRVPRKETNIYKSQADTTSRTKPSIQPQLLGVSVNVEKRVMRPQQFGFSSNLAANYGKSATEPQAENQEFQSSKDAIDGINQGSQRLVGNRDNVLRNRSYSRWDQMDQTKNFHRHPKPDTEPKAQNQGFQSKKDSINDISQASQRLVETGDIVVRNRSRSRWDQLDQTENFHRHPKPAAEPQAQNRGFQSTKDLMHDINQNSQRLVGTRDITVCNRSRSRWDQMDRKENFQGHPKPATEPQAQNQGFLSKKDLIDDINQTSQGLVGTGDIMVHYRSRSRWDQMIPTENSRRPLNPSMAQNHGFQSKGYSRDDINQASQRLVGTGEIVVRNRPHSRWDQKDPFTTTVRPVSPMRETIQ